MSKTRLLSVLALGLGTIWPVDAFRVFLFLWVCTKEWAVQELFLEG